MPDQLINLTIDGAPVSVPPGTLVIEAAKQAGGLVPPYCYHPRLPVAGVWPMCLGEIEEAPQLPIARAPPGNPGHVVRHPSSQAEGARRPVAELPLVEPPLR